MFHARGVLSDRYRVTRKTVSRLDIMIELLRLLAILLRTDSVIWHARTETDHRNRLCHRVGSLVFVKISVFPTVAGLVNSANTKYLLGKHLDIMSKVAT